MGNKVFRRDGGEGLLPIATLRERLDVAIAPVAATREEPFAAIGARLAEDVVAPAPFPPTARALRRGVAVASNQTIGASPYAPVPLDRPIEVEVGDALPAGCDAVLAAEAVTRDFGGIQTAETVAPWTDAEPAGASVAGAIRLARAGDRVGPILAQAATLLGFAALPVRRVRVAVGHDGSLEAAAAARTLAALLPDTLATVAPLAGMADAPADLLLAVGVGDLDGDDPALDLVASRGRLDGFGVGLSPCAAVGWGWIADRPVLVVPRRLDGLVAAVSTLVLPVVRRLAGAPPPPSVERRLARKIVSRIGLTEVALLAVGDDGSWQPLGVARWSWPALLSARGWIELGPESEGLPDGATVAAASPQWCPTAPGGIT